MIFNQIAEINHITTIIAPHKLTPTINTPHYIVHAHMRRRWRGSCRVLRLFIYIRREEMYYNRMINSGDTFSDINCI